jgi:hypothetical protein
MQDAEIRTRQQPARLIPDRLVVIIVPALIVPMQLLYGCGGLRPFLHPVRPLGRRIPCHCLSVLAFTGG